MGLSYPKDSSFELIAFSDADHAGCLDTCKSTSGGIQFLGLEVTIAKSRLYGVGVTMLSQRGISWVKLKSIILDEELGGLVVGCLRSKNLGLVAAFDGSAIGGVWADILKAVTQTEDINVSFKDYFILKIANGSSTSYWKDHYSGEGSRLMSLFPRLFALGSFKDFKIKDRWHLVRELVMTFSSSW
ncbi:hypothetical protein Tco_1115520 [Tanacetum coccineum]